MCDCCGEEERNLAPSQNLDLASLVDGELRPGTVGTWRARLSGPEQRLVSESLAPTLAALGYSLEG
mgnify:CR=1 FL=1